MPPPLRRAPPARPFRSRRRRGAGPHRHAQGRVPRSDPRCDHRDRRPQVAANPGRQTTHRPLHPTAPTHRRTSPALAFTEPATSRQPDTLVHRPRATHPWPPRRSGLYVAADAAGIGHITPHQLRHTLATKAGHQQRDEPRSDRRIARTQDDVDDPDLRPHLQRTVTDEYFSVTTKVENLYTEPAQRQLPADAEGPNIRRIRGETSRVLGNGHCTRPAVLDCRYENDLRNLHPVHRYGATKMWAHLQPQGITVARCTEERLMWPTAGRRSPGARTAAPRSLLPAGPAVPPVRCPTPRFSPTTGVNTRFVQETKVCFSLLRSFLIFDTS